MAIESAVVVCRFPAPDKRGYIRARVVPTGHATHAPPNILAPAPLIPGRRCGATAQSALGWYRPSVGVPETLDGNCTQRCTCLTIFSSVQLPSNVSNGEVGPQG